VAGDSRAQTWTGNSGSSSWSIGANWSPVGIPVSGSNTELTFGATIQPSPNNDLAGMFTLNKMTFSSGDPAYSLIGNALDFHVNGSSVAPSIVDNSNNSVTIGNAVSLSNNLTVSGTGTGTITFNGAINGTSGLTYSGAGTLVLGNGGNAYFGTTVITSGTLQLAASNAVSTVSAVSVAGATLDLHGFNQSVPSLTLNSASGSPRPTVATGAGTLTLAGNVTMNGGGGPGGQMMGKLNLGGASPTFSIPSFSNEYYDLVISAAVSGGGGFSYNGMYSGGIYSILALNSANAYSGPTLVNAGIIYATAANALPMTTAVNLTSNIAGLSLNAPQTSNGVTAGNYNQSIGSLTGVVGSFVSLGSAELTVGFDNTSTTYPGIISGSGILQKVGSGTLTLSGANTYTGGTVVSGGTVRLGTSAALASVGGVYVGGGTFDLNGLNQTVGVLALQSTSGTARPTVTSGAGTLTLGGNVSMDGGGGTTGAGGGPGGQIMGKLDLGGATRTFSVTGRSSEVYDLVVSAPISGSGGITFNGVASGAGYSLMALNAANTYTGPTTVLSGILLSSAANALPAMTAVNLTSGTSILYLNAPQSINGVTAGGYNQSIGSLSGVAGSSAQMPGATLTVGNDNTDTTFAGYLVAGTLVKTGFGLLTLSALNNGSNITVTSGSVRADDLSTNGVGALGAGTFTLSTGTLQYGGTTAASSKAIVLNNYGYIKMLTNGANLTLNGVISESSAGSVFYVYGSSGVNTTVTLAAANTYSGPTAVFFRGVAAIQTIGNVGAGGMPSLLGESSNAPGNVLLGAQDDRGTLLLTGTNAAYSTDRGMTVGGSPLSFDGTGGVIAVQNAGTALTVTGQITSYNSNPIRYGNLVKAGPGTLVLTNTTNNYANGIYGGTSVEAGTLVVGAAGAVIPAGSKVQVSAGATLSIGYTSGDNNAGPIGAVTLNGGTISIPSGSPIYNLNQLTTSTAAGTVAISGAGAVQLNGTNSVISVNGNSAWTGGSGIIGGGYPPGVGPTTFAIAPGVTLNDGIPIGGSFRLIGGGTLYLTDPPNGHVTNMTVSQGRLRIDDLTLVNGFLTPLGAISGGVTPTLTLDGGILQYGGTTQTTAFPISLGPNGGTVEVSSAATTLTLTGNIAGVANSTVGPLVKAGPGALILNSTSNTYFAGITVNGGTLSVGLDAQLGLAAVTVNSGGNLLYTASTGTGRTFNLNAGTMSVASAATLSLGGATVGGGFLRGPGTFAVTGGTVLSGVTTTVNAVINQTGAGSFINVTNGGSLTVAAGSATPSSFSSFTNQGSGVITIAATSLVNVAEFQTYGTLTLNPAVVGSLMFTEMVNTGSSPLFFNGGSRTFLGTPATANLNGSPTFVAGIDLNGKNAVVAGGLFVNNGFVVDSSNMGTGTATIVADFGALVKGAGFFQNPVITQNGGRMQAGNSPGVASFGRFVFGPGGVSNYVFAIDDATGTAGPSPDALGHVSGWGLVKAFKEHFGATTTAGDFLWTATPNDKLTVAIDTLINPTTVGTDVPGPMSNFDPHSTYSWPAAHWAGTYSGPTDAATLNVATSFDTSGFLNPTAGTFGWSLDPAGQTLSLVYAPSAVPEPGTLALTAVTIAVGGGLRRRLKRDDG
jgi:autotransporter-associated beta strand protein